MKRPLRSRSGSLIDVISRGIRFLLKHGPKKTIERTLLELYRMRGRPFADHDGAGGESSGRRQYSFDSDIYRQWSEKFEPDDRVLLEQHEIARTFRLKPLISLVTPVFNPDVTVFAGMIGSVMDQTYDNWELCLADASTNAEIGELIRQSEEKNPQRLRVKRLDRNLGIAGNSNEALKLATGDFVALLDHDDVIAPWALFDIAKCVNDNPQADCIFSDRDILFPGGMRAHPFFKPGWSPDLLMSQNYLCHIAVFRRELIETLGGFRAGFDGAQDYDLFLRATEATRNVIHIPRILYHWRVVQGSASVDHDAKPYAYDAAQK